MLNKTLIIAEAGVNHNGSIKIAKKLVDIAVAADTDFVKFQTFKAKTLLTKNAEKAEYQKLQTDKCESQFDMIKRLELSKSDHKILHSYCKEKGIPFVSTAFDKDSINLLLEFDIPFFKIPSGDITNLPYLRYIGSMGKPVIMSTGMADLEEVRIAMEILLEGGLKKSELTILHCSTEYPTPMIDVNLKAMETIRNELDVKVGYSDHTNGIEVAIAAVALGASVIEKHFTIDRNLSGPDHSASLEPKELQAMVSAIRNIELATGDGKKTPNKSEKKNIVIARKSIVAKKKIKKGEFFSEKNITVKRPGTGISPMKWDEILGSIAGENYYENDLIQ
ncbi:MAG: N-acetylneuraminate synthase [Candidatus Marinimicrobia bacterium]|nr:N-acetylneuraminate synthase [Candidatus Neomarinimicrobiota bacterium]|tara:strand:+ start:26550 stop:27554 length:1005 start_codon:yes stop_codon:yes gene_type:complete